MTYYVSPGGNGSDPTSGDWTKAYNHPQTAIAAANGGAFGSFPTHRRRQVQMTPAIDNIFVRGWRIVDAHASDWPLTLSDHRPLLCRLSS